MPQAKGIFGTNHLFTAVSVLKFMYEKDEKDRDGIDLFLVEFHF